VAPRWVFASGNAGKLAEVRAFLSGTRIECVPQSLLGVLPADETAATFVENALLKARHAAAATGLPAIADDSGLVVNALGGAPGVLSARYAGPEADDAANIDYLLAALRDVAAHDRSATFHCVIVALRRPDDPAPVIASGHWLGRIAEARSGSGGFGYDPVFVDVATGRVAAELSLEEKNRSSHRGAALTELARKLRQLGP
jgi:XTP/dITP diphosphohydrolase